MENTRKKMSVGERYLSFVIDNENYCIDILKVKELLGMTTITSTQNGQFYKRRYKLTRTNYTHYRLALKIWSRRNSVYKANRDYNCGSKLFWGRHAYGNYC